MTRNIYQLQKESIKINIRNIVGDKISYDVKLNIIGEYELSDDSKTGIQISKIIWDLCNINCWDEFDWELGKTINKDSVILYPTNKFRGICNNDIIIDTKDGLYLAEDIGWKKIDLIEEGIYTIIGRYDSIRWDEIRNKSDYSCASFF